MVYKTSLLLLLWAGVTASAVVELDKRIYNGQPCHRPYHVKLLNHVNGIAICGGSLISSEWVLTAAHCMDRAMVAEVDVQTGNGRLIPQPRIADDPQFIRHDLMLLKLSAPITGINPVAPPDCRKKPKIGEEVQVAGHGAISAYPNNTKKCEFTPQLHCGNMKIVKCKSFEKELKKTCRTFYNEVKDGHWLCYESPVVDVCSGDSGGGVEYQGRIYGVHVFSSTLACHQPAAFMDLCHKKYAKWITETTGIPWPLRH